MRLTKLCFFSMSILKSSSLASQSTSKSHRRKGRRRRHLQLSQHTKLQSHPSKETLRDRWIDLLQNNYDPSNSIRLETSQEEKYYYSAELLADRLLFGLDDEDGNLNNALPPPSLYLSSPNGIRIWNSIALGSSGFLVVFPLVMMFVEIFPPSTLPAMGTFLSTLITSVNNSITPYFIPTIKTLQSSIRDGFFQAQTIVCSLPYLLRHVRRIKVIPLIIKIIRRCIIIEAWRHIWIRLYKISKRVWKGALAGTATAYTRFCPAWIRRGIKSMFQSMVQAHIHGVVGSAVGGVFGGITFDSLTWSTTGSTSVEHFSDGLVGEVSAGDIESVTHDIPVDDSLENIFESVDASVDMVAPALEAAVESIEDLADDLVDDAISESVSSTFEDLMNSGVSESVSESLDSIVDEIIESN